jgi:hypothetical protein
MDAKTALSALAAFGITASALGASAEERDETEHHCVLPWGVDLNAVLDTELQILTNIKCTSVPAHERFAPITVWWFNQPGGAPGVPLAYPAGYTPTSNVPARDYMPKVQSATYVVHPSGKSYTFSAKRLERYTHPATVRDLFGGSGQFPATWDNLPTETWLPPLPGLKAGQYTVDVSVTLSEVACDGTSTDFALACLPAGTTSFGTFSVTVVDDS